MGRVAVRKKNVAIRPHDNEKLLRSVKKYSDEALEQLVKLMRESEDEMVRMKCADKIIDFQRGLARDIDNSELSRLVLDLKMNNSLTAVPQQQSGPVLDFENINPMYKEDDPQIVDFSDIKQIG